MSDVMRTVDPHKFAHVLAQIIEEAINDSKELGYQSAANEVFEILSSHRFDFSQDDGMITYWVEEDE